MTLSCRGQYFAFSILVTVNWPLILSASNLTLSPTLTFLSMAGPARETPLSSFVHLEFLDWTMLQRDLARRLIELSNGALDHLRMGGCDREMRAATLWRMPISTCEFHTCDLRGYLMTTVPTIPASRCPGIRQANSNVPRLLKRQKFQRAFGNQCLSVRIVMPSRMLLHLPACLSLSARLASELIDLIVDVFSTNGFPLRFTSMRFGRTPSRRILPADNFDHAGGKFGSPGWPAEVRRLVREAGGGTSQRENGANGADGLIAAWNLLCVRAWTVCFAAGDVEFSGRRAGERFAALRVAGPAATPATS